MADKPTVSIILPAFNEEKAIENVLDEIIAVMKDSGYEYDITVVDDCSTDRTAELAEQKNVRVIRRVKQGGTGASRKTGIRAVKGDVVVMLDADGSYTPADIPKMLEHFPEYDQVIGARTTEQGYWRPLRWFAKWSLRMLAQYLTKTKIADLNSGLKAFKREEMLQFMWLIPNGFSCVTTMTMAFINNDYSVKWIPTEYRKRVGKSKFHPVQDTFMYLLTIIRMIMYYNPLRIFLPISFVIFGAGLVKTVLDIFYITEYKSVFVDTVLLLSGLFVGLMGLLADLIVKLGHARQKN